MRVLAVDFGTSNTVAGLVVDGGAPRLVTIDGSPLVPSSVYLTDDGALAVGRDADRQARIDPSRYEPNPKRRVDDGALLLGSTAVPVTTVIAGVLGRVTAEVHRQLGGAPDQVRLTHPARWGQRRRETLVAAARLAGLSDDPVLVPEPVAAATHFATLSGRGLADGQALAVYDLGGGTFDIAVVCRRGNGYEVLAEAGLPDLGGLDFDHAVVEHIGRTHAESVDAEAWRRLLTPVDATSRRMARALATDVREGKEALSRYPHVDIALPQPFTDLHLTRTEFEDLIRPDLSRSIDLMRRTIADSGLEPTQLAGVYLVGGSSRVPLVARLIQQGLGVTPTTLDEPETSVVTGALYLGASNPTARPTGPQPVVAPPLGPPTPAQLPAQPTVQATMAAPVQSAVPTGGAPVPAQAGPAAGSAAFPTGPPTGPPAGPLTGPQTGSQPASGRFTVAQPAIGPYTPPQQAPVPYPAPRPPVTAVFGAQRAVPPPVPVAAPSAGGRPRRRTVLLAGGGAVAVVAAVVVALVVTLGDPGGAAAGRRQAAKANAAYDRYFPDAHVRAYVRPVYGDITSCSTGVLGEAVPGSATCTFRNGVQVTVGHADDKLLPLDQLRQLVASTVEVSQDLTREQGEWPGGSLDTFHSTSGDGGAALYWDRRQGDIWGLAASDTLKPDQLKSWWQDHFGK